MRLKPNEFLIQNLEEMWPPESLYYMPKEQALEELKRLTGEDFGYDISAWRQWFKLNSKPGRKDEEESKG